jgi:hypothetical protein
MLTLSSLPHYLLFLLLFFFFSLAVSLHLYHGIARMQNNIKWVKWVSLVLYLQKKGEENANVNLRN